MGLLHPKHSKASHLNAVEAQAPTLSSHPGLWLQNLVSAYTASERAGLQGTSIISKNGMGYEMEQRSKPQTLGYALADSPVGLLAWIYEKLHEWTDGYPWTDEEILKWVSVYWFSTAGVAANILRSLALRGRRWASRPSTEVRSICKVWDCAVSERHECATGSVVEDLGNVVL